MSTMEPSEQHNRHPTYTVVSSGMESLRIPQVQPSVLGKKVYDAMQSENSTCLSDVTIISSNGIRFPAVRVILATNSSYFYKMFTSQFLERHQSDIHVSISSTPLREVLEFIYTGDCVLLRNIRRNQAESTSVPCQLFRDLIGLSQAADYLNVDKLLPICETALTYSVREHPHLACIFLDEFEEAPFWNTKLCIIAKFMVGFRSRSALLSSYEGCDMSCGVMHFSEAAARKVFRYVVEKARGHQIHEIFQALLVWATKGSVLRASGKRGSREEIPILLHLEKTNYAEDRFSTSKQIATWFKLTDFRPKFLSDVVEASGLVEQDCVNKTYKDLLLQIDEESSPNERRNGSFTSSHR